MRLFFIAVCAAAACSATWAEGTTSDAHAAATFSAMLLADAAPAQGQPPPPPTPQQRVAMLKQWLQASQSQLRAYQWIETTVISKGGEQKSSTQKQCYYGADGTLQKIELSKTASDSGGPPGILPFGRLMKKGAEHKKEEVTEYMKRAVALVHSYVPPDPARIQQVVNAGKLAVNMVQPGRLVRLNFSDYLKPGDLLGVEIELPTNRLVKISVASYLDAPSDAVTLNVDMGVLPDGTMYASQMNLDAKAKDITVAVQNTGYQRR